MLTSLNNGGLTELRIVMVLNAVLFIAALIALVLVVFNKLIDNTGVLAMVFATALLFCVLNYRLYTEIFYWFAGAMCYSWSFIFGLIGMIIDAYLSFQNISGRKWRIVSIIGFICGIIACGGSMTVVMFCCYYVMLAVLYRV